MGLGHVCALTFTPSCSAVLLIFLACVFTSQDFILLLSEGVPSSSTTPPGPATTALSSLKGSDVSWNLNFFTPYVPTHAPRQKQLPTTREPTLIGSMQSYLPSILGSIVDFFVDDGSIPGVEEKERKSLIDQLFKPAPKPPSPRLYGVAYHDISLPGLREACTRLLQWTHVDNSTNITLPQHLHADGAVVLAVLIQVPLTVSTLLLTVVVLTWIVLETYFKRLPKKPEKTEFEIRLELRIEQEKREKDAAIEAVLEMVPSPTPGGEEEEEARGRKFTMGGEPDKESGYASSDNESNYSDRSDEAYEVTKVEVYGPQTVTTTVMKELPPTYTVTRYFRQCRKGCGYVGRGFLEVFPACGRALVWGVRVWSVWGFLMVLDVLFGGVVLVVWGDGVRGWRVLGAVLLCVLVVWEVSGVTVMLSLAVWKALAALLHVVFLWLPVTCFSCLAGVWRVMVDIYRRRAVPTRSPSPSPEEVGIVISGSDPSPKRAAPVAVQKEWGSRLQKYWFIVTPPKRQPSSGKDERKVLTLAPISRNCFLKLEYCESELSEFLRSLQHPYIQRIESIKYVSGDRVAITQPYRKLGSLRDRIHGEATPAVDWAEKYLKQGVPFPTQKISEFGSQILKAMVYLHRKSFSEIKLNPLYHIHTGNIYVVERGGKEECRVGGYENTLLGYRTRLFKLILQNQSLPYSDVIMFGHIMYEMSSGQELTSFLPSSEDYKAVQDELCKKIIRYIFKRRSKYEFAHAIKQIKKKTFFSPSQMKRFLESFKGGKHVSPVIGSPVLVSGGPTYGPTPPSTHGPTVPSSTPTPSGSDPTPPSAPAQPSSISPPSGSSPTLASQEGESKNVSAGEGEEGEVIHESSST